MKYKKHPQNHPVTVDPFPGESSIVEIAISEGYHYYAMTDDVVTHGMEEISEAEARRAFRGVPPEMAHLIPFGSVPQKISRRQFFRALDVMGIDEELIDGIVAAAPRWVQIDYRDFTEAYNGDPSLVWVMEALGRTQADVDQLFEIGSEL